MFAPVAMSSLFIMGALASPFLDARVHAAAELPASLSAITIDPTNQDKMTFHLVAGGIDTQCYPVVKSTTEPLAPGRVYKCGSDPAVTFSYSGEDGKLELWLSNENGSFTGSAVISGSTAGEVALKLASLDG